MILEAQGFKVDNNVVYQDNLSLMQLDNKEKVRVKKKTWHINVRIFFVRDCISKSDMRVEHFSTDMLLADYYSKPIQGKKSDLS